MEIGSEISETERYITNQTQVLTMTENSAFAILDPAAAAVLASEGCEIMTGLMLAEIQGLKGRLELLDLLGDPPEEIMLKQPVQASWGSLRDASIVARFSHIDERAVGNSRAVYVVD